MERRAQAGWTAAGVLVVAAVGLPASVGAEARSAQLRPAPPIIWNAPAQLPRAEVGKPYSFSFCDPPGRRCGGPGARNPHGGLEGYYVFTAPITKGRLPSGLSLGHASGLLKGTPTKARNHTFTVCVTDAAAQRTPGVKFVPKCESVALTITAQTFTWAGRWAGTYRRVGESMWGDQCPDVIYSGRVTANITERGTILTITFAFDKTLWDVGARPCNYDWRSEPFTRTGFRVSGNTATLTGPISEWKLTLSRDMLNGTVRQTNGIRNETSFYLKRQ